MDGPWQKYQDTTVSSPPPAQGAPWEKYKSVAAEEGPPAKPTLLGRIGQAAGEAGEEMLQPIAEMGDMAMHPSKINTLGKAAMMASAFLPGAPAESAAAKTEAGAAFKELGISAEGKRNPDVFQDRIKTGIDKAKNTVSNTPGMAPQTSERAATETAAAGIGDKQKQVKDLERARWNHAREVGSNIDASGVSNIDDLHQVIGADVSGLKATGAKSVQDLKADRLKGQGELLDLKDKVFQLEQASTAGEEVGELHQARADVKGKQLENARSQLDHKQKVNDNLDAQIAQAEKAAAQPRKGGVPTRIQNGQDLIDLKQHLNSVDPSRLSAQELSELKMQKGHVDDALAELSKGNPEFGKAVAKANKQTEVNAARYGGDAAKQLGVDKALLEAEKKTGRAIVGKDATTNAIAGTSGIVQRIKNTAHVDWLKSNMRPNAFRQLMSNKLSNIFETVGADAEALRENRELIDHIIDTTGTKGGSQKKIVDNLQKVLDKISPSQAGVSLKMAPKQYRGSDPMVTRAINAAKAIGATISSGGKATAYGISKGAEALSGGGTAEAKRLGTLQKEMNKKEPRQIAGPMLGAYFSGTQDQQ